jgi:hypothetical protein
MNDASDSGHTRNVLRYRAAGPLGPEARDVLAGGATTASRDPAVHTSPEMLSPFHPCVSKRFATDLLRRAAWADTAAAEFSFALAADTTEAGETRKDDVPASSHNNTAKNIEQMEGFLARGIGALMMQPLDLIGLRPDEDTVVVDDVLQQEDVELHGDDLLAVQVFLRVVGRRLALRESRGLLAGEHLQLGRAVISPSTRLPDPTGLS